MRNRTWIVSGFLAGSRVAGTPQAIALTQRSSTHYLQRPDASHLTYDPARTSLAGYSDELALLKNGPVFGSVAYKEVNPGFELNDLGFIGRGDYRALSNLIGYQDFQAGRHVRSYNALLYTNNTWDFGGTTILRSVGASGNVNLNSLWNVNGGVSRSLSAYDNRLLRGGPLAAALPGWSSSAGVTSDSRWPLVVSLNGSYQHDASGGDERNVSVGFDLRPTSALHVTLTPMLDVL